MTDMFGAPIHKLPTQESIERTVVWIMVTEIGYLLLNFVLKVVRLRPLSEP